MTTLVRDAATEAYHDTEKLLYATAWKISRRYGLDYDTIAGLSGHVFMGAYKNHNPEKGPFAKFLVFRYHCAAMELIRQWKKEQAALGLVFSETLPDVDSEPGFDDTHLGADAQHVIELVLGIHRERFEHSPKGMRRVLVNELREQGWSRLRIDIAFEEIHDYL